MKRLAAGWVEPFRSIVLDIPEDAETKVISLEDWLPPTRKVDMWDNMGGKVTLAGDAAHAMVMCGSFLVTGSFPGNPRY